MCLLFSHEATMSVFLNNRYDSALTNTAAQTDISQFLKATLCFWHIYKNPIGFITALNKKNKNKKNTINA